jgi:hypothetical protein
MRETFAKLVRRSVHFLDGGVGRTLQILLGVGDFS